MSKSKKYSYSAVDREDGISWPSETSLESPENQSLPASGSKMSCILRLIVVITSVLCGGVVGYNLQRNPTSNGHVFENTSDLDICTIYLSEDMLIKLIILDNGVSFELHMQRFNGSFFRRSPYSGPPTPQMDETWGRFTEAGSSMLVKINQGPPVF